MWTRRETIRTIGMAAVPARARIDLAGILHEVQGRFMRLAIAKGMVNPKLSLRRRHC
jgi:hypothetical protein